MQIERLITVFDNRTEALKEEINIDYIELNQLKKIFNVSDDDPLMYKVYKINNDHIQTLNKLLENKIDFDIIANAYYVECVQL